MTKKQSAISEIFSKKLKMLRQDKGWSQGQVATQVNVEPERISKYERGTITPTMELATKFADLFEVSLDYLFREKADLGKNIKNKELFRRVEAIDNLPEKDQATLIDLMDAYIKRRKVEELGKSDF